MTESSSLAERLSLLPNSPLATMGPDGAEGPIVFLLDEDHGIPQVVDENVAIADVLVKEFGVTVIGVEDYPARSDYWNVDQPQPPSFLQAMPRQPHTQRRFEKAMRSCEYLVVGIDSAGWIEQILNEHSVSPAMDVAKHHGQVERSKHFVRAIFDEYRARSLTGNALINCGANHNDHIMSIALGRAEERPSWWPDAVFVRLRPPSLPSRLAGA